MRADSGNDKHDDVPAIQSLCDTEISLPKSSPVHMLCMGLQNLRWGDSIHSNTNTIHGFCNSHKNIVHLNIPGKHFVPAAIPTSPKSSLFFAIDPDINFFIIESEKAHHLTTLRLGRAVVPHNILVYVPIRQLNVIIIGYTLSKIVMSATLRTA
jgi:hypothetical protein